MANLGYIESSLNRLPPEVRAPIIEAFREITKNIRFGAPDTDAAARAENFGGHFVPLTTHGTPDTEVAVAHQLGRTPRVVFACLPLSTVNATLVDLTVTRAADSTYLYLSSSVASAAVLVYVE